MLYPLSYEGWAWRAVARDCADGVLSSVQGTSWACFDGL